MQKTSDKSSITPAQIQFGDTLTYEFGCRIDKETISIAESQIALSRRLYNDIVASMQTTLSALQVFVLEKAGSEASSLQANIETLTSEFVLAKTNNDEAAMSEIATIRRGKWKELSVIIKAVRKEHQGEIQERFLSRIGRKSTCDTYALRCKAVENGLGWATANAILDNALLAFKKSFVIGRAPRFANGAEISQDCLTLQFTRAGGAPASLILEGKLTDLSMSGNTKPGKRSYAEFKFRMGPASAGMYATGTWQYHRQLPEDCSIALARLVRKRIGQNCKWFIQLVVKTKNPIKIKSNDRLPLAAVHFGWAADTSGRRVAAIAEGADPSATSIIVLPSAIELGLDRSAAIQSERSNNRDKIVSQVKLIQVGEGVNPNLIDVLTKIRGTRPQNISANRLHYVCRLLKLENCLPQWLEDWRKQDKLQWQAQAHIALRARNTRRTFYRQIALDLAKRYDCIAIESLNLAETALKVNEKTGAKTEFGIKARSGRVVAALHEYESALRWAASKAGAAVIDVVAPSASQCSICGGLVKANDSNHQILYCQDCGADLDRKRNGAAFTWQLVNAMREDVVTSFWLEHQAAQSEKISKKTDKLTQIQSARRQNRLSSVQIAQTSSD